jgi:plastocyanin
MKRRVSALAGIVIAWSCAVPAWSQNPHVVNVVCCGFQDPANGNSNQTIIAQGITVQWVRIDAQNHTVTSGTMPGPGSGTLFNGNLSVGFPTTFSHTFNTLGSFPYFCSPHFGFGMTGTVHVLPPASATVVGTGCQGSSGQPLALATNGLPTVGNQTFGLAVSGGPAGAQAFIFLAAGTGPAVPVSPSCFAYLDLVSLSAFINAGLTPTGPQILSATGATTFTFPLPNLPQLGGLSGAAQAFVFDAGAPSGFVVSNAVALVLGA